MTLRLQLFAPDGLPEVRAGDDLGALVPASDLVDGDIVVVTSKVVAKAEGRVVTGDRDAAIDEATVRVVARRGPTRIVRTRHGLTMAAAGIDASNVEPGLLVLLPVDPDASARGLRAAIRERHGINVGVIVTDTAGRAWRTGQTDIAIGAAGLVVVDDHGGRTDSYGNPLAVTAPAVADELAGAAELALGKLTARPIAVIRGRDDLVLPPGGDGPGAAALIRPADQDLFGLGAREAVLRATAGEAADRTSYGAPLSAEELAATIEELTGTTPEPSADGLVWPDDGTDPGVVALVAFACGWRVAGDESPRLLTPLG